MILASAEARASHMAVKQALRLQFPAPLIPGLILSRPNRFVMEVLVGADKVSLSNSCRAAI